MLAGWCCVNQSAAFRSPNRNLNASLPACAAPIRPPATVQSAHAALRDIAAARSLALVRAGCLGDSRTPATVLHTMVGTAACTKEHVAFCFAVLAAHLRGQPLPRYEGDDKDAEL